jgi:hypothetical protein
MHLVETCEAAPQRALEELALRAGIDPACATDVAGAITTFCRARHGGENVQRDYALFLMERSGFSCGDIDSLADEVDLLRALRASDDPSTLYEAYRRNLLYPVNSDVEACGRMLMVNLKKVQVRPQEDTPLNEWPVAERLAGWVGAWRGGRGELTAVGIRGAEQGAWRELMPPALARVERERGLSATRLVWLD